VLLRGSTQYSTPQKLQSVPLCGCVRTREWKPTSLCLCAGALLLPGDTTSAANFRTSHQSAGGCRASHPHAMNVCSPTNCLMEQLLFVCHRQLELQLQCCQASKLYLHLSQLLLEEAVHCCFLRSCKTAQHRPTSQVTTPCVELEVFTPVSPLCLSLFLKHKLWAFRQLKHCLSAA
jgi:hypothetical protein